MRILQVPGQAGRSTPVKLAAAEVQGLAGWVLGLVRGWRRQRTASQKQLRLVETLSLGGKRQLMLVRCGDESFLVGGGMESVETIVRLKACGTPDAMDESVEAPCR